MPNVYVVQENKNLNYHDAKRFGKVCFLTNIEYMGMEGSHTDITIVQNIIENLKGFNPEEDCILLAGNLIMCGLVFHMAISATGVANFLMWDRRERKYFSVTFRLPKQLEVST